jgi:hypothetical protein
LAVGTDIAQYAHDLRLEAEVEHAVGLVDDHESDAAKVGHTASVGSKHVDHAARSANDDVWAALELCNLSLRVRADIELKKENKRPAR